MTREEIKKKAIQVYQNTLDATIEVQPPDWEKEETASIEVIETALLEAYKAGLEEAIVITHNNILKDNIIPNIRAKIKELEE